MESGINFPVYLLSGLGANLNVLFCFVPDLLLTKPTLPNCCSRRLPKGAVAGNGANSSWWWDQVFPDPGGHTSLTTISSMGKFSEFRKQRVGNIIWEHIFPARCVSIWRNVHQCNTLVLLHPSPTSVRDFSEGTEHSALFFPLFCLCWPAENIFTYSALLLLFHLSRPCRGGRACMGGGRLQQSVILWTSRSNWGGILANPPVQRI